MKNLIKKERQPLPKRHAPIENWQDYVYIQEAWLIENNLSKGGRVRILAVSEYERKEIVDNCGWSNRWNPIMTSLLGTEGVITDLRGSSGIEVKVDNSTTREFCYPFQLLERITS